jgi:hypothetical protein
LPFERYILCGYAAQERNEESRYFAMGARQYDPLSRGFLSAHKNNFSYRDVFELPKEGKPIFDIMNLPGHKSIETIQLYLQML